MTMQEAAILLAISTWTCIHEKINLDTRRISLSNLASSGEMLNGHIRQPHLPAVFRGQLLPSHRFFDTMTLWTEVDWKKSALEQLVLNQEYKDLLQAAVKQYSEGLVNASDFISHEGKGLVILLHGHPGVGKTLTAEAVAQDAKRPLVPFGIGSVTDGDFEVKLQRIFERCAQWRAILLIDEADVVLEKRSYEDIQRNGIVSIFLKHLEYFEGIVFLTTNLVANIDEAFLSRIQISISYPELDFEARKKVWYNFLQSLEQEENTERCSLANFRLEELAVTKLNGRQIRNAFNLAQMTASSKGQDLGFSHLKLAARATDRVREVLRDEKTTAESRKKTVFTNSNW